MIPVETALEAVLALVAPCPPETVDLRAAHGRVLAQAVAARRTQPPFDASAMDGYAVKAQEVEPDALFKVVGEAAAGHGWSGQLRAGQAVRIFTGAPVPEGADTIVIQEHVTRRGDLITIRDASDTGRHIRPAGGDFHTGDCMEAPRRLSAPDIALLAAMNVDCVTVRRKPVIALIATGDELVMPGETPGPDQIIASNTFGLAAMIDNAGGVARLLPIARDSVNSLEQAFVFAADADLIVTVGGASVGDHDLVATVAERQGMSRSFYKVAMRPGKPLMAGRMGQAAMLGLPGNPVSAMVCGDVFLRPMIRKMLGLGTDTPVLFAPLADPLPANGPRQHYMRARLEGGHLSAYAQQDSSLLSLLSKANALIIRPPHDPAQAQGASVSYLPLTD